MAKTGAPPRTGTKGMPSDEASSNLDNGAERVGLNFKVPPAFRREFKTYAAEHDISMADLLRECFEVYKESQK